MVDQAGMNSPVAARISIQLFVAAAFLAAFGALNSSQDGTSLVPALLLAAAVLVGLLLNARLHWWWADPVAGLVIVGYAVAEGRAALAPDARP